MVYNIQNLTHYRQASECCNHVNDALEGQNCRAVHGDAQVVAEPINITRDIAANVIIKLNRGGSSDDKIGFALVAGDDRRDECVFALFDELQNAKQIAEVITVNIHEKPSAAKYVYTHYTNWIDIVF